MEHPAHHIDHRSMAIFFPTAFPPMVSPETSAVTTRDSSTLSTDRCRSNSTTITAAVVPLTMPQISPTTSLQKLLTLLAFRIRRRDSRAPGSRWDAIA